MALRKALVAIVLSGALLTAGCAGSKVANKKDAGTKAAGGMIPELILPAEVDATVGGLVNYNPYSPKPLTGTWLYEPLMVQNSLTCENLPWLATKFAWEGATKLTFDIREGVKFSDGQPMTAKDVAFTFNLAKKYPAMDLAGVWNDTFGAHAKSVTASGNQVVFEFTGAAAPKFAGIISTKILPEHVYSKVGDPTKYVDKNPVGTGPFKVGSYNGRRLELVRRDDYWQADKIKVEKLRLEGQYEADQAVLKLRSGGLDFYSGEIPNPQKAFVAQDPKLNHFWYAPNGITVIAMNLTKAPFNDVKFREALAYGMDKQSATLKATYGIMKTASQSGLVMPLKKDLLPAPYTAENTVIPYDKAKAEQLLDAAGYKKGADGKRTNKDGSPLKITFAVQGGYIDYEAMANVFVPNFADLGFDIKQNKSQPEAVDQLKKNGKFDMMINFMGAGCDYANGIGATLATSQFPTKTDVLGNVERYSNPEVDKAVKDLSGTTDPAKVKELVGVLVKAMMTDYPVLPILYAPARGIYRTDHAVGWPTEQDPYANPQDGMRVILTHLTAP
jgi:peptide/nickel transport system substrate-binding protein